jgi:aryl-alcohol dehydrogenase-like predicted oxidoreductase
MDFQIAERVVELADKYGKAPAQVALAWLLSKTAIHAPIVGVSSVEQLGQLADATEIELDPADVDHLEQLYEPLENLLSFGIS